MCRIAKSLLRVRSASLQLSGGWLALSISDGTCNNPPASLQQGGCQAVPDHGQVVPHGSAAALLPPHRVQLRNCERSQQGARLRSGGPLRSPGQPPPQAQLRGPLPQHPEHRAWPRRKLEHSGLCALWARSPPWCPTLFLQIMSCSLQSPAGPLYMLCSTTKQGCSTDVHSTARYFCPFVAWLF